MKNIKKLRFSLIMILIMNIILINVDKCYSITNQYELINEIVNQCNAEVLNKNTLIVLDKIGDKNKVVCELFKILNKDFYIKKNNESNYSLNCKKSKVKGNLKIINVNNEYKINIILSDKGNENEIFYYKAIMENYLHSKNIEFKSFFYLKSYIEEKDLCKLNRNIICFLNNKNCKNVKSIKLNNKSFSTSAYTGLYDEVKTSTELFDFSYALCSYNSGNYLIIGTPEIFINY